MVNNLIARLAKPKSMVMLLHAYIPCSNLQLIFPLTQKATDKENSSLTDFSILNRFFFLLACLKVQWLT